jgi:acyl-CoA thioesterase-2
VQQTERAAPGLADLLHITALGDGRWAAPPGLAALPGLTAVPGTQLLGQLAAVADLVLDGAPLRSLHTVFSRPVPLACPHVVEAEVLARGANAGSARLSVVSDGRSCVTATALALSPQPLEPEHSPPAPGALPPDSAPARTSRLPGLEQRSADDVDVHDPATVRAPRALVWVRAVGLPSTSGAAALAYATEPLLLGPSLLPHAGWSVSQAFTRFTAAVVSHTVWLHAPVHAGDWWLLDLHSPHLAGGRAFTRADVFGEDGALLASVAQEGLLRPLSAGPPKEGIRG